MCNYYVTGYPFLYSMTDAFLWYRLMVCEVWLPDVMSASVSGVLWSYLQYE